MSPWAMLVVLVVAGAALRLIDLDTLAYRWDEDLSSLAAKGVALHGIPELPSGMIYLRGLLFTYLLAACGALLGFSEWALRFPAALFGIAMIPLAFLFGKKLFDTRIGLLVAALVTFSVWDIEFSRYARMYAPFSLFYVLTLLLIWRYRVLEESLRGGLLCVASALLTVSLHALGYTLAAAFWIPVLISVRRTLHEPVRLVFPAAASATVAAFFLAWGKLQDRLFTRPAWLAEARSESAGEAGGDPLSGLETDLAADGSAFEAAAARIADVLSQLSAPPIPLFQALAEIEPAAAAATIVLAVGAAAVFCFAARRVLERSALILLPIIALCCGLQLFNLALLGTLALGLVKRRGVAALRGSDCVFAIVLIGASFLLWTALALRLDLAAAEGAGAGGGLKATIRALLDYPSFYVFWAFPNEFPMMSIPAVVGGLWVFDRVARPAPAANALFLLAAFALPTILNGLVETRYSTFRYNVPFDTLFFTFVALGVLRWRDVYAAWRSDQPAAPGTRAFGALVTTLLAAAVVTYDMNPVRSWLVTQRAYSNEGALYSFFGLRGFRDFRSAAEYVSLHARENDTIIVFDCREYFNYLGQLDYCLVSGTYRDGPELIQVYAEDGVLRDLYVSTPLIMSAEELHETLVGDGGTKWILATRSTVMNPRSVDDDLRRAFERFEDHVVHTGRDGDTKVYKF